MFEVGLVTILLPCDNEILGSSSGFGDEDSLGVVI